MSTKLIYIYIYIYIWRNGWFGESNKIRKITGKVDKPKHWQ